MLINDNKLLIVATSWNRELNFTLSPDSPSLPLAFAHTHLEHELEQRVEVLGRRRRDEDVAVAQAHAARDGQAQCSRL